MINEHLAQRWRLPWLQFTSQEKKAASARLTEEIHAFAEYMQPTAAEKRAAAQAFEDVESVFRAIAPKYTLETIGSRASGLADPLSDIDINVRQTGGAWLDDVDDRPTALKTLKQWGIALRQQWYSGTLRILGVRSNARVPVLEAFHFPTSFPVQVQHTVTGFNSTEYAKAFVKEHPSVRAVYLVLKQMLAMRGLMHGRLGGLTSYPLLNMIVAHIKLSESNLEQDDVAGLLLSFLDRYGHVDFKHTRFSVVPPACIPLDVEEISGTEALPKTSPGAQGNDSAEFMTLIDPADPSNNLGRNFKNIKAVQELLKDVHTQLRDAMDRWNRRIDAGKEPTEISLLASMLEGEYTAFEVSRASLRTIDGTEVDAAAAFE
jgi:hypothetical protein